ncbi:hypothetical protein K438DRAFT_1779533 [Mycena galopus ATCC 62051]|nr:hypothetical protein K438DRAFT_1779533 [Mycena galopus ATCC 62051]
MLLCISTTLAKLTNHTIDPAVQPEQLPRGVDESDIGWDINNYPELDYCSAVYVFLNAVGGCVFAVDNVDVGAWNDMPSPDGGIKLVYSNTSLCSEPHVLVIAPRRADVDIELDYIIYTTPASAQSSGTLSGDSGPGAGCVCAAFPREETESAAEDIEFPTINMPGVSGEHRIVIPSQAIHWAINIVLFFVETDYSKISIFGTIRGKYKSITCLSLNQITMSSRVNSG